MLPNNCTHSHPEATLGTSQVSNTAAVGVTHIPLVTSSPLHLARVGNYFYVKKCPYSHSPFHQLSHSNPHFREFPALCPPPLSLPESLNIKPTSDPPQTALTPDHPVPGLLFLTQASDSTESASATRSLPLSENTLRPSNPQHSTVTLSTSNLFSALATRPGRYSPFRRLLLSLLWLLGPAGVSARAHFLAFSADPYPRSDPFSPPPRWGERGIVGLLVGRRGPPAPLPLALQGLRRGAQGLSA